METIYFRSRGWRITDHDFRGTIRKLAIGIVASFACGTLFSHPLKMSVANLNYDESQKVYHIDLRMFIDDYLEVIGVAPEPGSPYVSLKLKPLKKDVKKYLDQHLFIYFNGELIPLKLSSFKLDDFTIQVTYVLESDLTPNQVEQIKVVDTIYLDEFSSQRNIIHVNFPGRSRKSLVFNTNQREDVLEW